MARARQIARVLERHHLWHVIELMALEHMVPIGHQRPQSGQTSKMVAPRDLRMALEELGPTFMKLGQVLSTRADLLPPEFQTELAQLQDRTPVVPTEAVIATIEDELGQPVDESFASFEGAPLATGSIGQAHLATLADGTEVVVKVRRPGAVEQIDEDLKLLHRLAAVASGRLGAIEDGFFHADLHPGNLFIETEKRIGLIDFGMAGMIDQDAKAGLVQLLVALPRRDSDGMVDGLVALGMAEPKTDRVALKKDLDGLVSKYYDREIGEANLAAVFDDVFGVLRAHKLIMPSTLSRLAKTLVTAEGMVAQLDPSFRMIDATEPYVKRMVIEENSPLAWTKRFGRAAPDVLWLATESPRIVRRALGSVGKGEFALAVEPKGLEPLVRRVENAANRIVLGVIIAALVIAIGFVVTVYRPGASGGLLGTFLAGALGAGAVVVARLVWLATRKPPS